MDVIYYGRQFQPRDIAEKCVSVYAAGSGDRRVWYSENHSLSSSLDLVYGYCLSLERLCCGENVTCVKGAGLGARGIMMFHQMLFELMQAECFPSGAVDEWSGFYCRAFDMFCREFPLSKRLGGLSGELERIAAYVDMEAGVALYRINAVFSPDFHRDSYILGVDVKNFLNAISGSCPGIVLYCGGMPNLRLGCDLVAEVIAPLVYNAREHAFKASLGRMPAVTVYGLDNGEVLALYVIDNGQGIAEADLPRVFSRFTSKQAGFTGHGIGLYAVKSFVDGHGGKMDVVSRQGDGTSFTITLPVSALAAEKIQAAT